MKTTLKDLKRGEKGAALVITLVLLLIGGLIMAPLLAHMGTGQLAGQVHEKRMDELYAADAGVEDAIARIRYNPPQSWEIHDDPSGSYIYRYPDPLYVNGKAVNITIIKEDLDPTCREELRYRIISTATDGSSTKISTYLAVNYMDFSGLLDYAIASNGGISIGQGQGGGGSAAPEIYGDVYIHDKAQFGGDEDWIKHGHDIYDATERTVVFPTFGDLEPYYWDQVKHLAPDNRSTISISGHTDDDPYILSGLYVPDGNQSRLTIQGKGSVEIRGVVYVKGDLDFGTHQRLILGQDAVIFVAGNEHNESSSGTITDSPQFYVKGSGCIIARCDIDLSPMFLSDKGDPDEPDFVLIFSVECTTTLKPGGNFHGTVAGESSVTTQPNTIFRWTSAELKGLNFPMGIDPDDPDNLPPVMGVTVQSWHIETGS